MRYDRLKRREFMTLIGAAAWPLAARAQQGEPRRIGALMSIAENDPEGQSRVAAFEQRLRSLGWRNGDNISVNYRWAASNPDRMQTYGAELIAMKPELLLANSPQVTAILKQQTQTIPIVFVQVADSIGSAIVPNLAKPGGNVTGFASFQPEMGSKWLEILKELAPRVTRVAVLLDPKFAGYVAISQVIEEAAPSFGVKSMVARIPDGADIEKAINEFAREPDGGLIVLPSPITAVKRETIVALAAQNRLPAVYPYRYFSVVGGLLAYAVDSIDLYRRAAAYVDRILKGEKPGNLPVQQPTKFELVINLAAARVIGLEVPTRLLARADEIIE
jgi:putative ABC transport system substrate-binding protein